MTRKSRGRGTTAVLGFLLLFAGLVGGAVLWVIASGRPSASIDSFARASVGCTTTLSFAETGTFYVFEETGGTLDLPPGSCVPAATPNQDLATSISGPGAIELVADDSVRYESGEVSGASVARFDVTVAGDYEAVVTGPDPTRWAAVGRDPEEGVSTLQLGAVLSVIAGVVVGGLLLLMAGRRSRRVATPATPSGPGWGKPADPAERSWPPTPPDVPQTPIFPQRPDTPVEPLPPPPPLPSREPGGSSVGTPWGPPSAGTAARGGRTPTPDVGKPPDLPPILPGG